MKTITLKLIQTEGVCLMDNSINNNIDFTNISSYDWETLVLTIYDVDKFREFLNDKIKASPRPLIDTDYESNIDVLNEPSRVKYNNLKSILSKLEKEIIK